MKSFLPISFLLISMTLMSQEQMNESLPYTSIPEAPVTYTPGSVVSRMVDGLGFRYRWATEGLTEDDLNYAPGNEGRTISQTLRHLYGLSRTIANSAKKQPNDFTVKPPELGFEAQRKATLENFQLASELFLKTKDLAQHNVIFKRADKTTEFPFWNNINGPIEDAVWHAGQIVLLRRSAGNPINPKVNVFLGKLND
jgi:uncharacterized damage-inducible protein DinB